ncbi:MAG: glycosyltransferase [Blastochloris sp.]|nr:glycosyltransferase [Blastochloris sp.]
MTEQPSLGKGYRVLILSASAGTGHLKAAEALENAAHRNPSIVEVAHVDALDYTNKLFRDFYSKLYTKLIQDAPTFLGWWYENSDEPWKTDRMRLLLDRMNTGPLVRMIKELRPDMTICTHFLPAEIISHLIAKGDIEAKLSIVVTDFDFHAMWLSKTFHHYFVALEETKVHLTMLGLPQDRISVSGIPVHEIFSQQKNKGELCRKHKLRADLPILLLSAGALGVGPAETAVQVLRHLETPAQIIVICGKNEELQVKIRELSGTNYPPHLSVHVLGYTTEMDEWMTMADLYIGKPGGLTTAELLTKGVPMAILSPIPGQEERNSDHLLEKGVAIKCNEFTTLAYKIDLLFKNPGRLARMRACALELARPDAAAYVVQTLLMEMDREPHTVAKSEQLSMAKNNLKV